MGWRLFLKEENCCVITENIDPAVAVDGLLDGCLYLGFTGDVGLDKQRISTRILIAFAVEVPLLASTSAITTEAPSRA